MSLPPRRWTGRLLSSIFPAASKPMHQLCPPSLRVVLLWLIVYLAALLSCGTAQSQANPGTVTGTITDPVGALVSSAYVTLISGSQQMATAISDTQGIFRFTKLDPGLYTVTVESRGFRTEQRDI